MNKRDALADTLYGRAVGTNHGRAVAPPAYRMNEVTETKLGDGRSGGSPEILEERVEGREIEMERTGQCWRQVSLVVELHGLRHGQHDLKEQRGMD